MQTSSMLNFTDAVTAVRHTVDSRMNTRLRAANGALAALKTQLLDEIAELDATHSECIVVATLADHHFISLFILIMPVMHN
jgi:hypothetical protein